MSYLSFQNNAHTIKPIANTSRKRIDSSQDCCLSAATPNKHIPAPIQKASFLMVERDGV